MLQVFLLFPAALRQIMDLLVGRLCPMQTMISQFHMQRLLICKTVPIDQSQIVENIKLAYWWAGYYSGLYDAQQNAIQPSKK